ncbi:MAG TPA: hypothetical protein VGO59_10235 [Verrucomicrobiae bacterium]|jgi:hypothetical protein
MRSVLFIIQSDPRMSGRPAEAIRIASGLAAWEKVDVAVYLRGAAVLILGEDAEELVDGDNYTRYLPALRESGRALSVQQNAPGLNQAQTSVKEISDGQLAELASARDCVLRF